MERSASRIFRPRRFVVLQFVAILAAVLVATVGASIPAHAASCVYGYCVYHAHGDSGYGSDGTAIDIRIPDTTWTYNTYDGVAFNAFIVNSLNFNSALEAGVVFGWMDFCGKNTQYYHPYGTKDNGQTESANCGMSLTANGNYYWARAYHDSSGGHSRVENGSGSLLWKKDWGSYDPGDALNTTNAEVHQNTTTYPSWISLVNMFHASWLDHNGHWNYWSYTNVHDDCPYHAARYSPDAWQASFGC